MHCYINSKSLKIVKKNKKKTNQIICKKCDKYVNVCILPIKAVEHLYYISALFFKLALISSLSAVKKKCFPFLPFQHKNAIETVFVLVLQNIYAIEH